MDITKRGCRGFPDVGRRG